MAQIAVGTDGNDALFGSGGNTGDVLAGHGGNDWLDGGAGADLMLGGIGNDTYVVDDAGDVVGEFAAEGTDTVRTSLASYTLGATLENLVGIAATAQALTGNALANSITGGSGNDTLTGGAGNDAIDGGAGSDKAVLSGNRADYAASYDAATRTITLADQRAGAPDGTDTITGVELVQFADGTVSAGVFGQAPTAASLSASTIAENSANGTVIGTVTGVDPDPGSTLSYSLLDGAGGRFAINATTGALTVANAALLDFESAASHAITVRVTDELGLTFDKAFTINLTNVNDAPSNATLSGATIAENAANGTVVGTVTGVDQDAGASLSYSLVDSAGGRFAINASTGQLTVANGSALDYDTTPSHAITVRVTDQGGLTLDKAFTINLTNVNEAPSGASLSGGTVTENAANGTVVGTVTGSDPDAGASLSYSLLDNAGGRFAINAGNGQLTVADGALLDYEAATSHAVTVRLTDQGGLTFDQAFTINLTNVGGITLTGENLTGTGEEDVLHGGVGNDTLRGLGGNDLLDGGPLGADTMIGGAGHDTYLVDNTGDVVTENAGEGTDTVNASISYTLGANVENLTLTGANNVNGTGNGLDNWLQGNSGINTLTGGDGNDTLDGGANVDTMSGGAGNDVYVVDNAGDQAIENAGEGTDTVTTARFALGATSKP